MLVNQKEFFGSTGFVGREKEKKRRGGEENGCTQSK